MTISEENIDSTEIVPLGDKNKQWIAEKMCF